MNPAAGYPFWDKRSGRLVIAYVRKSALRLHRMPLVKTHFAIFLDPRLPGRRRNSSRIHRKPPRQGPLSPDFGPLGKRTRPRKEESKVDISPQSQDPHRVATGDRGPFDPFDEVCTQTQGPPQTRPGRDDLSRRDLHALRQQRGYAMKDSKAPPCARLRNRDEVESARGLSMKKSRAQQDVAQACEPAVAEQRWDKRFRRADAHLNCVTNKAILKYHAQWRNTEMQLFRNTPSNL